MFTKFSQVSWHEPQSSRKGSYSFSSHTYPAYPQAHRSINASHPVLSILDISNSSISTGDSDPLQCPSLFIHLFKRVRGEDDFCFPPQEITTATAVPTQSQEFRTAPGLLHGREGPKSSSALHHMHSWKARLEVRKSGSNPGYSGIG